ncbi:hypothetical protein [Burkholderia glumae]|uniref:N,N-dimethylformamidase alpha subunit domain-containing protein n=1 Tax=Burkholderia glumae TaxID=337 RepID=A0AAP9Y270_BURGL|nr:hypothetical protein [Burkholderia glumae]ACR29032.1 Hypothetical protein bglu_1g19190 [Burkholderia glumae BGR1]MCM2483130.1 hypothetical protein [Burkholderia glumae]MCM2506446.1 hypothetical protein [Burkholderia glumae]MCM2538117.1 hypothetical protein [Burkholderia glumae]NVE21663.1 hypothetical protein [Burkholderia glumae]
MFVFDPTRLDLAAEFRRQPYGRHSADLQYLLNFMRRPTNEAFHVLLIERPGMCWRLATMRPGARQPPEPTEYTFDNLEEAEWHVFTLRWARLVGLGAMPPGWPAGADADSPE